MHYTVAKNNYLISTDKDKIDITYVHAFLTQSYWSPGVQKDVVKKAMKGSLCFGVYKNKKQIGYARMVTDKTTFAYMADVFIDENYRCKGLRRILLATKDAHKLYEQCGFTSINNPERYMVYNPTGYKSK